MANQIEPQPLVIHDEAVEVFSREVQQQINESMRRMMEDSNAIGMGMAQFPPLPQAPVPGVQEFRYSVVDWERFNRREPEPRPTETVTIKLITRDGFTKTMKSPRPEGFRYIVPIRTPQRGMADIPIGDSVARHEFRLESERTMRNGTKMLIYREY